MKLTVSRKGVFLDGVEVPRCERVDLKNISCMNGMDVTLHLSVDEVDVQYGGRRSQSAPIDDVRQAISDAIASCALAENDKEGETHGRQQNQRNA